MRSLILIGLLVLAAEPVVGQSSSAGGDGQSLVAPARDANVELQRVRGLLDQSKLDEAESAVRKYTAQHPHNSDGYFLLGLTLFRRVQSMAKSSGTFLAPGEVPSTAIDPKKRDATIRESLEAYTEGAKYGKPSADDLKVVSFDFVLIGDYASADKWLSLAVEWNPADADGWYYLGRAKYSENRFEESIQSFQKCLALRPHYALAANGIGLSYEGLNKIPDAITWLNNAISWQDGSQKLSPEPYIDLGELLTQQARFDEALSPLQKAVAIDSRNIRAHEKLGKAFLSLNRLPEAQIEMEQTIALDPARSAPHYLLGQIYRKQGRLEKARSELERFQLLKAKEPPAKSGMQ